MNETTAKTKWCPIGRDQSQYWGTDSVPNGKCIGSECMAWRSDQAEPVVETAAQLGHIRIVYDRLGEGFCGLAGVPISSANQGGKA